MTDQLECELAQFYLCPDFYGSVKIAQILREDLGLLGYVIPMNKTDSQDHGVIVHKHSKKISYITKSGKIRKGAIDFTFNLHHSQNYIEIKRNRKTFPVKRLDALVRKLYPDALRVDYYGEASEFGNNWRINIPHIFDAVKLYQDLSDKLSKDNLSYESMMED
jgi:hypothetical protein